ncbi:hypothetical protein CA54_35190 [Symmachiella macrocystis]|uniref:Uncharacterized protein n=1 Tax=Symmachiella macrocystis TaxID=2527985 RepID=A0A5C6BQX4_9PLAN|nr:hypothetical protein [Symmachiella macrocystis]TWU14650.1 hypothetical protein CA54_35190 [Symmachiella macrocystis]
MQTFRAIDIGWPDSVGIDHGEGWICFQWEDHLYGREGLTIDMYGHCSRNMPFRSGIGLVDYVVHRDSITLRFAPELAKKLELDEEIEIRFDLADSEFEGLKAAMESVGGF